MDDNKKTQPPKLVDLQAEMISTLNKLVAALEENSKLKEKVHKLELQECDTIHIPPIQNGMAKIVNE